ncbi:MAG: flagellar basal body-associated FliL family protein [Rhodanobacteraceae bacterium]
MNLQSSEYAQLLYVGITVEVGDEKTKAFFEEHLPQVRNRMLMILSGQDAGNLVTSDGKQQLAKAIRDAILQPFDTAQPPTEVGNVLFTQFIVQ